MTNAVTKLEALLVRVQARRHARPAGLTPSRRSQPVDAAAVASGAAAASSMDVDISAYDQEIGDVLPSKPAEPRARSARPTGPPAEPLHSGPALDLERRHDETLTDMLLTDPVPRPSETTAEDDFPTGSLRQAGGASSRALASPVATVTTRDSDRVRYASPPTGPDGRRTHPTSFGELIRRSLRLRPQR